MNLKLTFLFSLLCSMAMAAPNTAPQVSIQAAIVDETAQTVTITYHLTDAESNPCDVWLKMSKDGGAFFDTIATGDLSQDVGTGIAPGNNKTVVWNYASLTGSIYATKIKLIASDNQVVSIADMVSQVDSNNLKSNLGFIAGVRHYNTGLAHLNEVRDSIESRFMKAHLKTERHNFTYSTQTGQNILGRKSGLKNEAVTYIMDAHYDGVSNGPAADDNGSGVAGMLEALRILSTYHFERTLNFIGFDFEESGLIGSNRYVQNGIKSFEDIQGVLNFEMIGYYTDSVRTQTTPAGFDILFPQAYQSLQMDSFRGNTLIACGNTTSSALLTEFTTAATQYVPALKVTSLEVPQNGAIAPDLRRSDHASFWDNGQKALMLTDGANTRNKNYHTPGDSIGTLNFTYMTNVVKATLATAAKLAVPLSAGFDERALYPASIEEHDHDFPAVVELYPNPSNGSVFLKTNSDQAFKSKVTVYDLKGALVWSKVIDFAKGTSTTELKMTDLPTASYILILTSGESSLSKSIVIKK